MLGGRSIKVLMNRALWNACRLAKCIVRPAACAERRGTGARGVEAACYMEWPGMRSDIRVKSGARVPSPFQLRHPATSNRVTRSALDEWMHSTSVPCLLHVQRHMHPQSSFPTHPHSRCTLTLGPLAPTAVEGRPRVWPAPRAGGRCAAPPPQRLC